VLEDDSTYSFSVPRNGRPLYLRDPCGSTGQNGIRSEFQQVIAACTFLKVVAWFRLRHSRPRFFVDEGRKRVLLIAAAILAARKLAQQDRVARTPATMTIISDAVRWAEEIMREIDKRFGTNLAGG
jgi:uncharacterized lipoprotein YmbA